MNEIEALSEIYDAVGDDERWRRLEVRRESMLHISPEVERHFAIARQAHEEYLGRARHVAVLSELYNQIAAGAILLDRDAAVVRVNNTAREILTSRDGLEIVDGQVRAVSTTDDAALRQMILRAASGNNANQQAELPFTRVTRPGRRPLVVLIRQAPAIPAFLDDQALVMVMVLDLDRAAAPAADALRGLYGMTEREAEFALLLMRGLDVKEAARELGVAVTTARTFLAHIREKTDSHNQAELMQRLLAIPHP